MITYKDAEDAITTPTAAKILGCTRQHILYLIENKSLVHVIRIGRQYVLSESEVRDFAKSWMKQHD
jgi:excisionase family DNA binding protein